MFKGAALRDERCSRLDLIGRFPPLGYAAQDSHIKEIELA
jgi:hypothetical protein